MVEDYRSRISRLIRKLPFDIEEDWEMTGRAPTLASSEFLTNKQQGDWAERIVLEAINNSSLDYTAMSYGKSDDLAAGDPGFTDFYADYLRELNRIGKAPDILIFDRALRPAADIEELDKSTVSSAVAAIEVRSSSFLANKYADFMEQRTRNALRECESLCKRLLAPPYATLLKGKNETLYNILCNATPETFKELDFRAVHYSSSSQLEQMSRLLKALKVQIKLLHKRDYLSITPKLEDLALVNRWIQSFGVRHFYLQVFFDKAYLISFEEILALASNSDNEGAVFSVERDVKNQQKTTLKINVKIGKELLGRIEMPEHSSELKELERGRLLYYVTFSGGRGYLDPNVFNKEVIGDAR